MSAKIVLYGKSRQEIAELTAKMDRDRLLDLLFLHVTIEPKFSPGTVAKANEMTKRQIVARCQDRRIAAHKPMDNGWRIPMTSLWAWDEQTAMRLTRNGTALSE